MNKLRIYLETSAVSNLHQPNSPDAQADMLDLWEMIKSGKFEVFLSSVLFDELDEMKDLNKREILRKFIDQIDYEFIRFENSMVPIVDLITKNSILTENHIKDCKHIACAVAKKCDCIVTYNLKHMLKISTLRGVRSIAILFNGTLIDIVKAHQLLVKRGRDES